MDANANAQSITWKEYYAIIPGRVFNPIEPAPLSKKAARPPTPCERWPVSQQSAFPPIAEDEYADADNEDEDDDGEYITTDDDDNDDNA